MQEVNRKLAALPAIRTRTIEETARFTSTGGSDDASAVKFLNGIFETAIARSASDIHIEFHELDGMKCRIRLGNDMVTLDYKLLPTESFAAKAKICAKSNLDSQERLLPQDGRLMFFSASRRFDVRIAITPTVTGYKIVCRLLDSSNTNIFMDSLDMPFLVKECMKRVAAQNEGVLLMSGPTGSGKTTSLYAILQFLNTDTRHIVTIENPVEYVIDQFTQIEVTGNLTFSRAIRSALRLDPDVIMIGEIRDEESAKIAWQAGATGHMMLSTVHANSAAGTISRIASLGVKNSEISAVLSAMVAQRLVKSIPNQDDIEWKKPSNVEKDWLIKQGLYGEFQLFPSVEKSKMGGRVAMVEMIEMNRTIRDLLDTDADINSILTRIIDEAVLQPQFETLAQAGVRLALEGKTTLSEVMQAAADIGYIPKRKRFEQILILQGDITIDELDALQRETSTLRLAGKSVNLADQIMESKICSPEVIKEAVRMAGII